MLSSFLFYDCGNDQKGGRQKSREMISIRTLGLAYLEENKLEEAETEFLKLIDIAPKEKLGYANLGLTYLRMGRYEEAEAKAKQAIEIDPEDPEVRLILAKVYQMNGDPPESSVSELRESLKYNPGHTKTLYNLSELYASGADEESMKQREFYTLELVESVPGNIVPRLNLIELLIEKGDSDRALEQMEEISKLFPEFPAEATGYYDQALGALQLADNEGAITPFKIFHNYIKVTSPYQAGIMELKGPGGSLIGFPVITFDQKAATQFDEWVSDLDAIDFTDVTIASGLDLISASQTADNPDYTKPAHLSIIDYDGDGDMDIYSENQLFRNDMGKFTDVSSLAGIQHAEIESSAVFGDYDNDGYIDLYIIKKGGNILFKNSGDGTFSNVTEDAGLDHASDGNMSLFFDADHDGDLDIFEGTGSENILFRNNSDGTFLEQAGKMNLTGGNAITRDAAFGDFDNDGDIDLFVANENAANIFHSNQRQGIFLDKTDEVGLKSDGNSGAVCVGDYNNDGFLDLFVTSLNGENHALYRNQGEGKFENVNLPDEMFSAIRNLKGYDAEFLDFDNDGFLDLLVVGESSNHEGNGVILLHNEGDGDFIDATYLLPGDLKSGKQIGVLDYNNDGGQDIAIAGMNGGIRLLQNKGGNINHFVNLKLVGLRTGSAKNNYYGIGAKVEIRAGDLYQTKVVTRPNVHFGIGKRRKADVIRITWTNGVPQNIFFPDTDQDLIEKQILKGSCPFLYTWNGEEYMFVKDIMWRSALGMPLGIMGGTTSYGFADASDDYLKIPGENLKPKNGRYSIQVTSELWEAIYIDQVRLVAVDHPGSIEVFVDEQFSPPPFPDYRVYQVAEKHLPVSAKDTKGNNILSFISEKDDKYLSNFKLGKYQGITEMRDVILDFGEIDPAENFYLFLDGWIFPTDASINVALAQSDAIRVIPPIVQIVNKQGEWETVIERLGFPMGKDKMVIADLSGKFLSKDHRIRIRTNMEIYWDQIFYSDCNSDAPVHSFEMIPVSADLHYRGFSGTFRKGGRYGPHWFDYSDVSIQAKWADLEGDYTRYGDVLVLLNESDDKYIVTNAGDETTIEFGDEGLPELPAGWKRDFMIRCVGWVKDGDMNTALGQTVSPLPFHGMKSYPPCDTNLYPSDTAHQNYQLKYNTRKVTRDDYLNAINDIQ